MKTEELEVEEEVLSKVDLVQRSGTEERENSSSGRGGHEGYGSEGKEEKKNYKEDWRRRLEVEEGKKT